MKPRTKLERLLEEDDKGVSSANGALSKILRTFWKDLGFRHEQIGVLMEKWLEDPANEYDQEPTKLNNSRGNLRKDHERDDLTWKLFTRNLRVMYPLEVRFLIRLRLKNGSTYRQVAIMRPPSSKKFNSDNVFKDLQWHSLDEDGFTHEDPSNYDDEGFKEGEEGYLPKSICVFDQDDKGFYYCSEEQLFKHVDNLPKSKYDIEVQNTDDLFEQILPHVQETWGEELGDHLKRVSWADTGYDLISHDGFLADGFHRIVKAKLTGIKTLRVKFIKELPKLSYIQWKDCGENLTDRIKPHVGKKRR